MKRSRKGQLGRFVPIAHRPPELGPPPRPMTSEELEQLHKEQVAAGAALLLSAMRRQREGDRHAG